MSDAVIATDQAFDGAAVVAELNQLLRLRTTPIGMKLFATVEEMEQVPRIRRPKDIHTTDQIVGQAARNGWTVGITQQDLVGALEDPRAGLVPAARRVHDHPVVVRPQQADGLVHPLSGEELRLFDAFGGGQQGHAAAVALHHVV